MDRRFRLLVTAAAVAMLVLATAAPASALTFKGAGLYSSFSWGEVNHGLVVVVDKIGTDNPRATVATSTGKPLETFSLNFRSIGCGGSPSAGNLVFSIDGSTNARGAHFGTQSLLPFIEFDNVRSIWLDLGTGNDELEVCSVSLNFTKIDFNVVGDWDGDGAIAAQTGSGQLLGNLLLVEQRPGGNERLTFVHDRAHAGDDYQLRLVGGRCGRPAGTAYYAVTLTDVLVSSFTRRTFDIGQEKLDSVRSLRIKNVSDNQVVRCEPLSIIAILIG